MHFRRNTFRRFERARSDPTLQLRKLRFEVVVKSTQGHPPSLCGARLFLGTPQRGPRPPVNLPSLCSEGGGIMGLIATPKGLSHPAEAHRGAANSPSGSPTRARVLPSRKLFLTARPRVQHSRRALCVVSGLVTVPAASVLLQGGSTTSSPRIAFTPGAPDKGSNP